MTMLSSSHSRKKIGYGRVAARLGKDNASIIQGWFMIVRRFRGSRVLLSPVDTSHIDAAFVICLVRADPKLNGPDDLWTNNN